MGCFSFLFSSIFRFSLNVNVDFRRLSNQVPFICLCNKVIFIWMSWSFEQLETYCDTFILSYLIILFLVQFIFPYIFALDFDFHYQTYCSYFFLVPKTIKE